MFKVTHTTQNVRITRIVILGKHVVKRRIIPICAALIEMEYAAQMLTCVVPKVSSIYIDNDNKCRIYLQHDNI